MVGAQEGRNERERRKAGTVYDIFGVSRRTPEPQLQPILERLVTLTRLKSMAGAPQTLVPLQPIKALICSAVVGQSLCL